MPIRLQRRWLYSIDGPQIVDIVRFKRAKGISNAAPRRQGGLVWHLGDGRWWDAEVSARRSGRGRVVQSQPAVPSAETPTTEVYLATAHRDHDPGNSAWSNLRALCQRCHILYDREEHRRRWRIGFLLTGAIRGLFTRRYFA